MENALEKVMDLQVNDIVEAASCNIIEHKFSRRYNRKKKQIIKAYRLTEQNRNMNFKAEYRRIQFRQRVRFAAIIVILSLFITGAAAVTIYYVGNFYIVEHDDFSSVFFLDDNNAPTEICNDYRITSDMSEYAKEIMSDDAIEYWEIYKKGDKYVSFAYYTKAAYKNIRYNTEEALTKIENRSVNGYTGVFFETRKGVKCLTWDNGDYIFEFDFTISYDEAVRIIKSIIKK